MDTPSYSIENILATILFVVIYAARLSYQAYLLRKRDKTGSHGDWAELILVVIPKNILVVVVIYLLLVGIPFNTIFIVGWIIFLLGILFRMIALKELGSMYSLNIDIRQQHKLKTNGTYSIVRHPLYVAYFVDTLGIVIFLQKWYFYPVLIFIAIGWALRIKNEEIALRNIFGKEYDEYAKKVPAVNIVQGIYRLLIK